MSDARTISVVIPTFNRGELAERCVSAALVDQAASGVIVVDDGSTDDTWIRIERMHLSDSRVKLVRQDRNSGRAAARQRGVETANSELVLLLDDDVIAEPGLIDGHARAHSSADQLVVGYMPVADTTNPISALYASEYEGAISKYQDADMVLKKLWGGNVSVSKVNALAAGLADDERDSYHEDQRFGLRCQALGLQGRFDSTLRAKHYHQRDLDGFLRDAYKRGQAIGGTLSFGQMLLASKDTAWLMRTFLKPFTKKNTRLGRFGLKSLRRSALYQGIRDARSNSIKDDRFNSIKGAGHFR